MARQTNQTEDWFDHIGKGFWFAVGFTPAFVVVSGLMSLLFMMLFLGGINLSLSHLPGYEPQVRYVPVPTPSPMPAPTVVEKKPVAEIKETTMTEQQQQERECSLLLLKYQQTQDEAVKQKMYDICP